LAPQRIPPARIVKERRATFRASPDQLKTAAGGCDRLANLRVAGDYVDTGCLRRLKALFARLCGPAGFERAPVRVDHAAA